MIVVDTSVWINKIRGIETAAVRALSKPGNEATILVGDLILLEVLQGARTEAQAEKIERSMRVFAFDRMVDRPLVLAAARNYRALRKVGITIRTSIDVVIGTYCIEHGHSLLHDDRDFTPMVEHLGLRLA